MFALDGVIAVTCASVLAIHFAYLSSLPGADGRAAWQAYFQALTAAMTGYLFLDALGRRKVRGGDSAPAGNESKDSEARAKYSAALAELEIELGERYICNLLRKELANYYAEYERYRKGRLEADGDGDGDGDDSGGGDRDDIGDDGSDDNEDSAGDGSASDEASESESEMPELIDPLSEPGTCGLEAAEKELTGLTLSSP